VANLLASGTGADANHRDGLAADAGDDVAAGGEGAAVGAVAELTAVDLAGLDAGGGDRAADGRRKGCEVAAHGHDAAGGGIQAGAAVAERSLRRRSKLKYDQKAKDNEDPGADEPKRAAVPLTVAHSDASRYVGAAEPEQREE